MSSMTIGHWISLAQFVWLVVLTVGAYLRKPGDDAGRAVATLKEATENAIAALRLEVSRSQQEATQDMAERRSRVSHEIAELRSNQALMDERMRHLPTHNDIRALIDGMADMRGKLGALADGQRAQQNTLQLIQDFMHSKR